MTTFLRHHNTIEEQRAQADAEHEHFAQIARQDIEYDVIQQQQAEILWAMALEEGDPDNPYWDPAWGDTGDPEDELDDEELLTRNTAGDVTGALPPEDQEEEDE